MDIKLINSIFLLIKRFSSLSDLHYDYQKNTSIKIKDDNCRCLEKYKPLKNAPIILPIYANLQEEKIYDFFCLVWKIRNCYVPTIEIIEIPWHYLTLNLQDEEKIYAHAFKNNITEARQACILEACNLAKYSAYINYSIINKVIRQEKTFTFLNNTCSLYEFCKERILYLHDKQALIYINTYSLHHK